MKKTLLAIAATLSFGYANAQMKLGNNPTTTNSNALLEMETSNKGLLLPRVALTSTTAFAPLSAHVAGMAVYNTATAGDVTPGYYFDNGTSWVRLSDASALRLTTGAGVGKVLTSDAAGNATWQTPAAGSNIYTADGTLAAARTVTQGTNNLTFTGTGNLIKTGGNVGIGNAAPTNLLTVGSNFLSNVTGAGATFNSGNGGASIGVKGWAEILESTAFPAQLWFAKDENYSTGAGALYYLSANNRLGISNSTSAAGTGGLATIFLEGATSATSKMLLLTDGIERMRIESNGNVGIGTATPTNKLHINAATNPIRLEGLQAGAAADKFVTVDATGVLRTLEASKPQNATVRLTAAETTTRGIIGSLYHFVAATPLVNSIAGATIAANGDITVPAGTYQIVLTMEGAVLSDASPPASFYMHSYFYDFPSGARIHSNTCSNLGSASNHGVSITYTTVLTTSTLIPFNIGYGQGGNVATSANLRFTQGCQLSVTKLN